MERKWEEQEVRRSGKEEVCDQPTARATYIGKGAQRHRERSGEKGTKKEGPVLGMDIRYPYNKSGCCFVSMCLPFCLSHPSDLSVLHACVCSQMGQGYKKSKPPQR